MKPHAANRVPKYSDEEIYALTDAELAKCHDTAMRKAAILTHGYDPNKLGMAWDRLRERFDDEIWNRKHRKQG